jgi:hypothetical protein
MTEDEKNERTVDRPNGRLVGALVTLASGAALLWHDSTRDSPPPLNGVVPWMGLFAGVVLLWAALHRTGRLLEASACLVGAVGLAWLDEPSWPTFFSALVGLVILWEAIPLRVIEAALFGVAVALAGIVPFFPYWLVLGGVWLVLLGFALPFSVGIAATMARWFEVKAEPPERPRTSRGAHASEPSS